MKNTCTKVIKKGLVGLTTPLKKGLIGLSVLFLSAAFVLPEES
ncbi:hypothetical protein [Candidatus Electronema sp. TJ]